MASYVVEDCMHAEHHMAIATIIRSMYKPVGS